jgi:DNA recombination protein RmuC
MSSILVLCVCVVVAALSSFVTWVMVRTRSAVLLERVDLLEQALANAQADLKAANAANSDARERLATLSAALQEERKNTVEKLGLLNRATEELRETFQALAGEALKNNNVSFLELARAKLESYEEKTKGDLEARKVAVEALIEPIKTSLTKVDEQARAMEEARNQAYGALREQVASLVTSQDQLRSETGNLVKALRTPAVRGRWGEIQLKRVVEVAGMLPYCDFSEQETIRTEDGRMRPDLIVKLPGGKIVVVDAKTPLQAYLEAVEAKDDETRHGRLIEHARQVREHMERLSSKAYWEQFEASPEFVVMFLPGETFFSAALEQDPGLIEEGVKQRVIPASPTTLIALLRAVAYGWRQERLARNAQEISALGKELHDRLRGLANHLEAVGKGLDRAVESYNKAVGTLESRVMVSARKFAELGAPVTEEIPEVEPIETTTRTLALEWDEEEVDPSIDERETGT